MIKFLKVRLAKNCSLSRSIGKWRDEFITAYFIPKEDLIIRFYNEDKLMWISFEMYKIREKYGYPDILIEIPFQEGSFKVTNPYKPRLIAVE